ncbi:HAMP domain-containing histidine kinase [Limnochorda pilosa]|uniref:histidine kinase n=1 Tax=Limnochorda pilosa TaxID=1555112 RepID=A0A0K2SPD0_LIMPI|nr:HAMP domain-containing histidine kinase [Limnochorda pilosa]BAS28961.1 histidine kinase [Limnochorda pilosa]
MRTVFGKLLIHDVLLIVVTMSILASAVGYLAVDYSFSDRRRELVSQAEALSALISNGYLVRSDPETAHFLLETVDRMADARVWVVNDQGLVLLTSLSHTRWEGFRLSADELQKVRAGLVVSRVDLIPQLGEPTFSVAAPVMAGGRVAGAVLLHAPISGVMATVQRIRTLVLYASLLALSLALLLAFFVSRRITRPVREMTAFAQAMRQGRFDHRIEVEEEDEIGQLAKTFNHLSRELGLTIDALTREKRQRESIVQSMSEGVLAVDVRGHILLVNPQARQLLELAGGEAEGRPAEEVLPAEWFQPFQRCLQEGMPVEGIRPTGGRTLRLRVAPIDGGGRVEGAVGLVEDITEQRRVEQMRRDFVANVSHELRTPLTSLRGFLQAIREGVVTDPREIGRYLGVMHGETMRLIRLVNSLLDLSRIEGGQVQLHRQALALAPVVEDVLVSMHPRMEENALRVETDIPQDLPAVWADRDRLDQILINLLENAVRYAGREGQVRVAARSLGDAVVVAVEDTGPGIPAEELPYVWDRFYKVDKARTADGSGTGLGLVIVRQLVELHGGRAWAESQPGQGSRFFFSLPQAQGQEETGPVSA